MMTQAKRQTLMLAVSVALAVTGAKEHFSGRLRAEGGERGSQSLEWAIIAAIVVALAAIVTIKITGAVQSHVAQIK
jgi:hypothetical protein